MSEHACETVGGKKDRAYDNTLDVSNREDSTEMETSKAVTYTRHCQTHHLMTCMAVTLTTTVLVMVLTLCLGPFVIWMAASDMVQTCKASAKELPEWLQQCQRESHNLMLQDVTQDPRCRLCPDGWLWWSTSCYFFSLGLQDNRRWNESADFCRRYNSSLVVIKDCAEMEFLQVTMRSFPEVPFLWVGLTDARQEGRWLWWDGTDVQHYMPLVVEWDADHRDCADLRAGGSLFAADCEAYGPWVCERDS